MAARRLLLWYLVTLLHALHCPRFELLATYSIDVGPTVTCLVHGHADELQRIGCILEQLCCDLIVEAPPALRRGSLFTHPSQRRSMRRTPVCVETPVSEAPFTTIKRALAAKAERRSFPVPGALMEASMRGCSTMSCTGIPSQALAWLDESEPA